MIDSNKKVSFYLYEKRTENCLSAAPAAARFWDEPTHPSRHPTPHLLQTTYSPAGNPESHWCACLSAALITTPTWDCMNFEPGFQVRTSSPPAPHQSATTPITQLWDRVNPNPESQLGILRDILLKAQQSISRLTHRLALGPNVWPRTPEPLQDWKSVVIQLGHSLTVISILMCLTPCVFVIPKTLLVLLPHLFIW